MWLFFKNFLMIHLKEIEVNDSLYFFQEIREKTSSPLGSTGSVTDSIKSESVTSSVPEDTKNSDAETGKYFNQYYVYFSIKNS